MTDTVRISVNPNESITLLISANAQLMRLRM